MSIVKMKRLRMITLASEREELLSRLLHAGCVELSEPQVEATDPEWTSLLRRSDSSLADVKQEQAQVAAALQTLNKYAPAKGGLFRARKQVRETEFFCDAALEQTLAQAEEINRRERELTSIQSQETRLAARKLSLAPWAGLDAELDLASTKNVKIAFSVCPAAVDLDAMRAALAQAAPTAEIFEASSDREQHYFMWMCHVTEDEDALAAMKPYGVSPAPLKGFTGTAADNIAAVEKEEQALSGQRALLEQEIAAMADCRSALEVGIDRLQQECAKAECAQRALTDDTIVFFTGWTTVSGLPEVEKELAQFTCAWESEDPSPEEYPEVPVKLKNNKLTQPLNMVTEMYVYPAYDGVDPNPLMAPFFVVFFGMMMADMGYGIVMLLGGWLMLNKMHVRGTLANMAGLAILCGVSTFVFGALTGGFLGDFIPQLLKIINPESTFQLPYLFTPLTDTLAILIGALVLGAIQIITGMTISVIRKFQSGDWMDALFDEISWWLILAGGAMAIFGIGNVKGVPVVLVIGALMLTVGGTREAKGFGKVSKWIGIVYNGISGFFSDILSYARLMALMLAGAVIAQVFNTLGAVTGNVIGFVIISLIGNVLNLALNLLGCYVHDLRLQCLEFFGRFYKEGGKPFAPLAFKTKYVDIIKEEN